MADSDIVTAGIESRAVTTLSRWSRLFETATRDRAMATDRRVAVRETGAAVIGSPNATGDEP